MFNKILADHDDVFSHGTILYTNDSNSVYADKACTIAVDGETLKDIYLKGCVVATVSNGSIISYSKPTSLIINDEVDIPFISTDWAGDVDPEIQAHFVSDKVYAKSELTGSIVDILSKRDSRVLETLNISDMVYKEGAGYYAFTKNMRDEEVSTAYMTSAGFYVVYDETIAEPWGSYSKPPKPGIYFTSSNTSYTKTGRLYREGGVSLRIIDNVVDSIDARLAAVEKK